MPLYAIVAHDKPGALDHRLAVRPEHLKHLEGLGDRLVFAGPFQDEEGKATGSIVVIAADDLAAATELFMADPFIVQGVFGDYQIRRWALTINNSAGR